MDRRENSILRFVVPGTPIPKGSLAPLPSGKMRSDNKKLKKWQSMVSNYARMAVTQNSFNSVRYDYCTTIGNKRYKVNKRVCFDEPVVVHAQFFFAPIQKPRWGILHGTKPDLDKLQRAIGDALQAANIVSEDSRICAWSAWPGKQYGEPPRVEIFIVKANYYLKFRGHCD